jgi:hypothetical protein
MRTGKSRQRHHLTHGGHSLGELTMKTTSYRLRSMVFFFLMFPMLPALAVTPQNGAWSIDPENNGQPGRGFQLETQNSVLVLTFYGYDNTGNSTFYLMSAPIVNSTASGDLGQYTGVISFFL